MKRMKEDRVENSAKEPGGTSTLDLALRLIDYLATQNQPLTLAQIAKAFGASKATVYRHLVTLQRHGLVRQDADTSRYEPGIKLLMLGESVRARFDVATIGRQEAEQLGAATGQAVTICRLIDWKLVVLDLLHGRTVIEFGTRPGTELSIHSSAHGKIWLAYSGPELFDHVVSQPMKQWAPRTITRAERLREEIALVRERGWAAAPDELITAVNALAAPIFNHHNDIVGSVAIVGATQFIPEPPNPEQIEVVLATAHRISERLGWRNT
ncbi:IclR family transcriptional regulator [Corticibacterium sp. UT-5YL-CI-8]|nr:IclR family transcriptional regulator [Tianweitania sp. UT-5YL-CI-8]